MRKQHPSLLLHPFFIACLLLLLLNDFILKATFHNWLTGKLSDVAGLAAFALFFTSTMPRHKGGVYIITALLFMWWKSPLAQPLIQLCHAAHIPFTRVVDYSDYLALLVLPVAWLCKPVIINSLHKKLATYSAGAISVFAFCATSLPYRFLPTSPTGIEGRRFVNTPITLQQVAKKLDSMGIQYTIDSFNVYPETSFNNYFRGYRNNMQYFYKRYDSATNTVVAANLPGVTQENLYRRYATTPYILIHNLAVDGEVIPSIKLVNSGNAMTESRYLQINEIELSQDAYNKFLNRQHKTRKYYENKIYRALLSKLQ